METRIEVKFKAGIVDAAGKAVRERVESDLGLKLDSVHTVEVFTIDKELEPEQIERCREELFTDPLTQESCVGRPVAEQFDWLIEVGFLPGVTDNIGRTARSAVSDLLEVEFEPGEAVYYSRQYLLQTELGWDSINVIAGLLHNPLIQRITIMDQASFKDSDGVAVSVPKVKLPVSEQVDEVDLDLSDEELLKLGQSGILDHVAEDGTEVRRGPLALDLDFLYVIRDYFLNEGRKPTDVELECIAQTWSEHCKHNIFAAKIDEIDSLYSTYIKAATREIRERLGEDDWCLSVFTDNSGVIDFNDEYNICYKAETHNSPSALDPYGGAITGIVGVNRDPMGTGTGSLLVTNMYGFCFGDPYFDGELIYRGRDRSNPILHPKVIFEGVRVGVEHGGNKSGIPTPSGFLVFDERYMGKPLVFVGTVGLMPKELNGSPTYQKKAEPGDLIVMAGGRVGKDGIHGATFSSEGMHEDSPATAVQIGDPITQKKLHDAQLVAQQRGLYNSVTDNGAGGISCSICEMARESGGCEVELDKVPIKYSGILPYEVWISESQERMTYSVPPDDIDEFLELLRSWDAEATVIGSFTNSGRCLVKLHDKTIMDMDLEFLHNGLPQKVLTSEWSAPNHPEPEIPAKHDYTRDLVEMLARLNICSREYVVRQYDHEVQAGSVIKPLVGLHSDVHSDATVTRPLLESHCGVSLASGILPWYGDIDPAAMASCGIDTVIRNLVSVGTNPERIALLDNFCWCSSDDPYRLGQLKRAAKACYDTALEAMAPFISGKDSMFNDFKGFDKDSNPIKISVPPTLLISGIGRVDDIRECVSLDCKMAGDLVYVIGATGDECGGSEYYAYAGERERGARFIGSEVPSVNMPEAMQRYRKLHQAILAGLLASCQPVGLGGLAVALAKKVMASELGMGVDLSHLPLLGELSEDKVLFSETQSRMVVTVARDNREKFEELMQDEPYDLVGVVNDTGNLTIRGVGGEVVVDSHVESLKASYKKTLDW